MSKCCHVYVYVCVCVCSTPLVPWVSSHLRHTTAGWPWQQLRHFWTPDRQIEIWNRASQPVRLQLLVLSATSNVAHLHTPSTRGLIASTILCLKAPRYTVTLPSQFCWSVAAFHAAAHVFCTTAEKNGRKQSVAGWYEASYQASSQQNAQNAFTDKEPP